MAVIVVYAFVLVAIVWFITRWRSRINIELIKKLPSKSWHTHLGFGYILTLSNFLRITLNYGDKYGPNSILWMGPYHLLLTSDPQTIKDIFASKFCLDKPAEMYHGLSSLSGDGLISESEPVWSNHRKLINKAFVNKNLISFLPDFNSEINKIVNALGQSVDKGEDLDMLVELRSLSLKNATKTILKRDIELSNFNCAAMAVHCEHLLKLGVRYLLQPLFTNLWFRKYIEPHVFKDATKALEMYSNFIDESVNIARKHDTDDKSYLPNKFSVLDCCINISDQKELENDEIHGLLLQFYLAAFETVSTTLFMALALLAMFPEYQDRAYEEVCNILSDSDAELTLAQLDQLKFLEMVFNETMRVVPIVPTVFRKVSIEDVKLSNDLTLPVGQIIAIDIFRLHRCKEVWGPDAHAFNPDNFLPANVAARHPYAFIPFTKGQRFCIGWRYGTLFFKIALAKLIKTFKFSTDFDFKNLKFENHITVKLLDEPRLKLERRSA